MSLRMPLVVESGFVASLVLALAPGALRLLVAGVIRALRGRTGRKFVRRMLRDQPMTALMIAVLGFMRFGSPLPLADVKPCIADVLEHKEANLLEGPIATPDVQARVAIHKTTHALQIRVLSGTIRLSRRRKWVPPFSRRTIVTTDQVRLTQIDATVCVRVEGDRTSVMVTEGSVRISVLEIEQGYRRNSGGHVKAREVDQMSLRSGDWADVTRDVNGLVVRLGNLISLPSECSLTRDLGSCVLADGEDISW